MSHVDEDLELYYYIGPRCATRCTLSLIVEEILRAPDQRHLIWRSPWEEWSLWTKVPVLRDLINAALHTKKRLSGKSLKLKRKSASTASTRSTPDQVSDRGSSLSIYQRRLRSPEVMQQRDHLEWVGYDFNPSLRSLRDQNRFIKLWEARKFSSELPVAESGWTTSNGTLRGGEHEWTFTPEEGHSYLSLKLSRFHRAQCNVRSVHPFDVLLKLGGRSEDAFFSEFKSESASGLGYYRTRVNTQHWPQCPADILVTITIDLKRRYLSVRYGERSRCIRWSPPIVESHVRLILSGVQSIHLSPLRVGEQGRGAEEAWGAPKSMKQLKTVGKKWRDTPMSDVVTGGFFLTLTSSPTVPSGVILTGGGVWGEHEWTPIYGPVIHSQTLQPTPIQLCYLGPQWRDVWVKWADEYIRAPGLIPRFTYTHPHLGPAKRVGSQPTPTEASQIQCFKEYLKYINTPAKRRARLVRKWVASDRALALAVQDPYAHFMAARALLEEDQDQHRDQIMYHYRIASLAGEACGSCNLANVLPDGSSEAFELRAIGISPNNLHNTIVNY